MDADGLAPFSLIDDERWGTGMSATLPFLNRIEYPQHDLIDDYCRKDMSSRLSNRSMEDPPPEYAPHDPSTPIQETQRSAFATASDVDTSRRISQSLTQEQYERSQALVREDSATGLTWRSDVSAWELKRSGKQGEQGDSRVPSLASSDTSSEEEMYTAVQSPMELSSPTEEMPPTLRTHDLLRLVGPRRSYSSLDRTSSGSRTPESSASSSLSAPSSLSSSSSAPPIDKKAVRVSFVGEPVEPPTPEDEKTRKWKEASKRRSESPRSSSLEKSLCKALYACDLEKAQQLLRMDVNPDLVHGNHPAMTAAAMWGFGAISMAMASHVIEEATGTCAVCNLTANDLQLEANFTHAALAHGLSADAAATGMCGTPLATAAWMGKPDVVLVLLEHGAPLNQQGGKYRHVLCAAAAEAGFAGNLEVAKLLVHAGAEVRTAFGPHGNALSLAMKRRDYWLVKADEQPSLPSVESRIASCELMVRFLERAEVHAAAYGNGAGSSSELRR